MISVELIRSWLPDRAVGADQTVEMAGLAYAISATVGLLIALAEGAGLRWLYRACRIYIEFIRGTPTLTQLFLIYFGLASLGVVIPGFQAAVVALGLHYAAYMAEVYRSGIAAIDRGQSEAAAALGLRCTHAMRLVVLPQAIRIILPPMTNFAISLLKDTSVAPLIAAPELIMHANDITSEYYMPMPVYLINGAFYFILAYPLSLLVGYFERRTGRSRLRNDPSGTRGDPGLARRALDRRAMTFGQRRRVRPPAAPAAPTRRLRRAPARSARTSPRSPPR